MQERGRKQDEIVRLDRIGHSFYKMEGMGTEQDVDLIVGMKMLKFHIFGIGAGVKVKKVKQRILDVIDNDKAFFFIIDLVQHKIDLLSLE